MVTVTIVTKCCFHSLLKTCSWALCRLCFLGFLPPLLLGIPPFQPSPSFPFLPWPQGTSANLTQCCQNRSWSSKGTPSAIAGPFATASTETGSYNSIAIRFASVLQLLCLFEYLIFKCHFTSYQHCFGVFEGIYYCYSLPSKSVARSSACS